MTTRFVYGINGLKFLLGFAAIGFGIGFPRYFDHWVYFPTFPNILDLIGMALIGIYLLIEVIIDVQKRNK